MNFLRLDFDKYVYAKVVCKDVWANEMPASNRSRSAASKSVGNYLLSNTLGEGTFGKVKVGVHLLTGEKVAVKVCVHTRCNGDFTRPRPTHGALRAPQVLEKDRIVDKGDIKRVTREIQILKHIRHPNVRARRSGEGTGRGLRARARVACRGRG